MLINQNFSIAAASSAIVTFDIVGADSLVNLDGVDIWWAAYEQQYGSPLVDVDPVITKSTLSGTGIEVPGSPPLQFIVRFEPDDTVNLLRNYYHEAKYLDTDGNHVACACGIMTVLPTELRNGL